MVLSVVATAYQTLEISRAVLRAPAEDRSRVLAKMQLSTAAGVAGGALGWVVGGVLGVLAAGAVAVTAPAILAAAAVVGGIAGAVWLGSRATEWTEQAVDDYLEPER
jgi:uncharacterized protein YcfJ